MFVTKRSAVVLNIWRTYTRKFNQFSQGYNISSKYKRGSQCYQERQKSLSQKK